MSFLLPPKVPPLRPLIILYGDDKTEEGFKLDSGGGWAAGLAEIYSRKADIIVRGYKGYSTESAVSVLNKHQISTSNDVDPAAIVVSFGANDKTSFDYKRNMEEIVKLLKEFYHSDTLVVLLTPLPLFGRALIRYCGGTGDDSEETFYGGTLLMREQPDHMESFANMCLKVAFNLDLPCVDVWHGMHAHQNWQHEYFREEGLYLSRRGNRFVCDAVARVLSDHDLSPLTMETDLPLQRFP